LKIGVVAPASRLEPAIAERVRALADAQFGSAGLEIRFHDQCFLSDGHFAGDDRARAAALVEFANDPALDAVWFGRGGYGACRLLPDVLPKLNEAARHKAYLGYSDAGSLLGALYGGGFTRVAHGPMPTDILRPDGEAAIARALAFLLGHAPEALEGGIRAGIPHAAFNLTILSHLIGTPWQPNLGGHVLLLEEVSEHMYRMDRALFHVTSNARIREIAGIRLGRCSAIPPNEPEFGRSEEEVVQHWCGVSGIAYLGRADIGHDAGNKVVPFGLLRGS
jgi:muramoyltetrapeptide carboxypeptidase